jgi:hypothetical protein
MPFNSGNVATFSLGGNDISQYTTSVTLNLERNISDINPIGGAAISKLVGPYGGTISLEGGYDPVVDAILAAYMLATTPATIAFIYRPAGSGGGTRTISGNCYFSSYETATPGDDTATWTAELAISGTVTNA